MMNKLLLSFFTFLIALASQAQAARKYSNEFLNIGVDAASLGMSNAVVALSGDVNSTYWNPAGLVRTEEKELSLMHASYFANIAQYDYAAFSMPLDRESAIGINIIRFGVDDILNTTQLIDDQGNIDFNRISLFSTADYALNLSYARRLLVPGLSYGVNAKIVRRIIGDFASSWGVGLDAGVQFERNDWYFGIMARDITTTYNAWTIDEDKFEQISGAVAGQNQTLPETTEITLPKLQIGAARVWKWRYDYEVKAEIDLNVRFAQTNDILSTEAVSITPSLGGQFGYRDMIFLRAGVGNFQSIETINQNTEVQFQPNFGVGFKYRGIQVDYALTDIGDQSGAVYSNIFSLKLDFGVFR